MTAQIGLAALVASLTLLVQHYFPWRLVFRKDLPRVLAYVMGVLALAAPLSGLFVVWGEFASLVSLWVVIGAGGISVMGAYGLEWLLKKIREAEELGEVLRQREGSDGQDSESDL